jgi:hypothetical protein
MRKSVVYFLADDGKIKIGFTTTLDRRMAHYRQTRKNLEVLGVIPGDRSKERSMHERFAKHCLHGEWFLDCGELRAAIAQVITDPHEPPQERDHDALGRDLRKTFEGVADPAAELSRITGLSHQSCYNYIFKQRKAPGKLAYRLVRDPDYGEKFFNAFMAECHETWWQELQYAAQIIRAARISDDAARALCAQFQIIKRE